MRYPVVVHFVREGCNEPQVDVREQRRDYGEGDEPKTVPVVPPEPGWKREQQAESDMTRDVYDSLSS
jgi:hypothetical protein